MASIFEAGAPESDPPASKILRQRTSMRSPRFLRAAISESRLEMSPMFIVISSAVPLIFPAKYFFVDFDQLRPLPR